MRLRLRNRNKLLSRFTTLKRRTPLLSSIHLNFITLHYTYIIAVTLLCSIIVYPGGQLSYTDALFFSAGSATQSGLNPLDLNKLHTYQQVFLWLGSMVANPIVVHSFLVFVRLYWFEKRFQNVVREAMFWRRTKTRTWSRSRSGSGSGTKSGDQEREGDVERAERGVRGREIVVLRDEQGRAQGRFLEQGRTKVEGEEEDGESRGSERSGSFEREREGEDRDTGSPSERRRQVDDGEMEQPPRLPQRRPSDHHIAFLENQRRMTRALRIPSPREYDRGGMPQSVDDNEDNELARRVRSQSVDSRRKGQAGPGEHITIEEPEIMRHRRTSTTGFPRLGSRRHTTAEEQSKDRNEFPSARRTTSRRSTLTNFFRSLTQEEEQAPYLSWHPTLGRNSAFVDLTEEQRNELGGIEYRALKTLAGILIGYFLGFHLLGIVCLVPWILHTRWGQYVQQVGVGRPWWGVFMSGSAFNDQGFSLHPDSMIPFNNALFPLLLMTFLIIIGNTGFPCMLRFMIWFLWKCAPRGSALWEELHFLLDHPRRCFTLLFPRSATWWLFWVLVLLNGIDLIFFIILDINDPDISDIAHGTRVVVGLFQAAATRTAGLAAVNIADLHPAIHVSYLVMMYISVYPIAISMRRTNVYEERSLGVYYSPEDELEDEDSSEKSTSDKEPSYVGSHLRRQLGFDLWYIFLGVFLIAIIEGSRLDTTTDIGFTMWAILFEVVSAYGTVGLSLGYPGTSTSFSAQFKTLSKLIIIAMMIRGRHRGLPYALDRAVLLPSEALHKKEADDAARRMRRRSSAASAVSGYTPPGAVFRPETGLSSGVAWRGQDWAQRRDSTRRGTAVSSIANANASINTAAGATETGSAPIPVPGQAQGKSQGQAHGQSQSQSYASPPSPRSTGNSKGNVERLGSSVDDVSPTQVCGAAGGGAGDGATDTSPSQRMPVSRNVERLPTHEEHEHEEEGGHGHGQGSG